MCGILGIVNFRSDFKLPKEKIIEMWKRIEHRGKDFFKIWVNGEEICANTIEKCVSEIPENFKVLIAQNTLNIVGKPCFPKESNGKVIASNGEVFNYSNNAESDLDAFFYLPLEKIQGIYACAEFDTRKNILKLFRDPIGVNPLCYFYDKRIFAFASESKSLKVMGNPEHLNPRKILCLNVSQNKVTFKEHPVKINFYHRAFTKDYKNLENLINSTIEVQTRGLKKFGIMFSGGIDSALIARLCQEHERNFTCFSCGIEGSEDIEIARKIAQEFGFRIKEIILEEDILIEGIKKVTYAAETNDFVQVSIAIPFYFTSLLSSKHGNKVIFSGLGSEELFAGYYKYRKNPEKIHEICAKGLENIWLKDLYRDNCVVMSNTQELRVPFLDIELVNYAMGISPELKVKNGIEKFALRKIAEKYLGEYAWRRKKASQYGSGVAKTIKRIAKKHGYKRKSDFVKFIGGF